MGKPKRFKKLLSFFLALLMLMSSLTVGFSAIVAFAKDDWVKADGSKLSQLVSSEGQPIGQSLLNIAQALYDDPSGAGEESNYVNLSGVSDFSGWRGVYIKDNDSGNAWKAASNAWNLIMNQVNAADRTKDVDTNVSNYMKSYLKDYMGSDYNSHWEYALDHMLGYSVYNGYHSSTTLFGGITNGYERSFNTVVQLTPGYYLWNAFDGDISKLPDDGVLPTQYISWWKTYARFGAGGYKAANGRKGFRARQATYVRVRELKAFHDLIGEDRAILEQGYQEFLTYGTFEGVDSVFEQLSQERQLELIQKTLNLMECVKGTKTAENPTPATVSYELATGNDT
ncbi:MAG: hypothetical protein K2N83_01205, partial [Eubacterium sp.]|nr:hypothetical protein [Eubacterium sp.]